MKSFSIKDLYLLLVILFSGRSLTFFISPIGLVLLFVLGVLVFKEQIRNVDKKLQTSIIIWLVYVVLAYISIHYINRFFWFVNLAKITIAYLLLTYYGEEIFKKYIKIVYGLCIISLIFWLWGTLNQPSLFAFISLIDLGGVYGGKGIGIYYIDPGSFAGTSRMFSFCNSGFCWEPGPFGSFASLALFFTIIQREQLVNYKRYAFVFLLATLTSQSTTAYLSLLIVFVAFLQNRINNNILRYFVFPFVLVVSFVLFSQVPVLKEKITNEYQEFENLDSHMDHFYNLDKQLSLGRFTSFSFDYLTFKQHPLFGINGNPQLHVLNQLYSDGSIASINGLGKIIAVYGLFGAFFFLLLLIKSSLYWKKRYKFRGWYLYIIIILVIGFSFSIIESPIIMTMLFDPVFIKENQTSQVVN